MIYTKGIKRMSYKRIFCIIIIVSFYACQGKPSDRANESSGDKENNEANKEHYGRIEPIVNSSLLNNWNNQILRSVFHEKYFKASTDTIRNMHTPSQIDTIYHFTTELSSVMIYRSPERDLLLDSDIYDTDLTLSSGIRIGASKKTVFAVLKKKFDNDTIIIRDFDSDAAYTLVFRKNELYYIHYNSYWD